jgi:hypothetical protein
VKGGVRDFGVLSVGEKKEAAYEIFCLKFSKTAPLDCG